MAATSGFNDNWQAGKTLAQCNLRMLQEEDTCDVTFLCGTDGHVVRAHRYVLISRSCVFHAMLTGPMAEKSDIKIPDIQPRFFKTFLRFIYTHQMDIDADNVTELLYISRKYQVNTLEAKCIRYMEKNLSSDNVFVILKEAHAFDLKHLFNTAMSFIKSQGEISLQSPDFLTLSKVLVDEIVGSDDLEAEEEVIFTAVNDWSEAECGRKKKKITPKSKRSVLGGILKKVRFPIMKGSFLAETVKASGLLTDQERLSCFDFVLSVRKTSTPFIHKRREKRTFVSKNRFLNTYDQFTFKRSCEVDAVSFASNAHLLIYGCQLFGKGKRGGDRKSEKYKVTSYLSDDDDNVLGRVVQEETEYPSDCDVFDVLFTRPVFVCAGEWYTLGVRIKGPETLCGKDGMFEIESDDGVEISFVCSTVDGSVTDAGVGQIPSLIYRRI